MRRITNPILLVALVAAAGPLAAETVDDVIAKHIAARGGEKWKSVESMKVTGTFTAFSNNGPFTLHRTSDNKYHIDHIWNGKPVVIGFDGENLWQVNTMMGQDWAQTVAGPERRSMMQDVDFVNPLFNYKEKGWSAELVGVTDLEGQEVIEIDLVHPDGYEEKWYLDSETYLEVARVDKGWDLGSQEFPRRTYYDDFRDVGGVKVPFFTETEWYTRHRMFEIDDVELNVAVEDELFGIPVPEGMEALQGLAGTWSIKIETRPQPGMPWSESQGTSRIEDLMNGSLIQEHFRGENGSEVIRTIAYDRYREKYRVTQMSSATIYPDLHEGTMEEGRLTVSNVESGTTFQTFGMTINQRDSIFDITADAFKAEQARSIDGGKNWFVNAKYTYTRAQE